MSIYFAGETTVSWDFSWSSAAHYQVLTGITPPPNPNEYESSVPSFSFTAGGASITVTRWSSSVYTSGGTGGITHSEGYEGVQITADTGLGDTDYGTDGIYYNLDYPEVEMHDYDFSGTGTISIDCNKYLEVSTVPDYPDFGGPRISEIPIETNDIWYLEAKVGGTLRVTASAGGATATAETVITSGDAYVLAYFAGLTAGITAKNYTNSATCEGTFQSAGLTSENYSRVEPYGSAVGGASFTVTATSPHESASGTESSTHTAFINAQCYPVKGYSVAGVTRHEDSAANRAYNYRVHRREGHGYELITTDTNGDWSDSYDQRQGIVSSIIDSVTIDDAVSINEWKEFTCYYASVEEQASDTGYNEDQDDWRVRLLGQAVLAGTISQSGQYSIDECSSTSGWVATDAVLSSGAGTLVITATGNPWSLTKTFSPLPQNFDAYSLLNIRAKCDQSLFPITLSINNKTWNNTTPTTIDTYGDILFDLCNPHNASGSTDTKDSKWILEDREIPWGTDDSIYWGCSDVSTLTISGYASGHVAGSGQITIDYLRQYRGETTSTSGGSSTLCFQAPFKYWTLAYEPVEDPNTGTTTTTYYRRFLDGNTCGKRSMEEPDFIKTSVVGGGSGIESVTYTTVAIIDMLAAVTGSVSGTPYHPGWTAACSLPSNTGCTGSVLSLSCLYTQATPANYLFGGGIMYTQTDVGLPSSGNWRFGFDLLCNSSKALYAQRHIDHIYWYPGCGDVYGFTGASSGTPGPILIKAAKLLRGQTNGLVFDGNTRLSSAIVELRQVDNNSFSGSGRTDTQGYYHTSYPNALGRHDHRGTAQVGDQPTTTAYIYTRQRQRICYKPVVEGEGWISYDLSDGYRHCRAFESSNSQYGSGNIWIGFARNVLGTDWVDIDTNIDGYRPCIRYDRQYHYQRLHLFYQATNTANSSLLYRTSTNEGVSWSSETVIGTGLYPTLYISRDGVKRFFWNHNNVLKGYVLDRTDQNIKEIYVAFSDITSGGLYADEWIDSNGLRQIGVAYCSSGSVAYKYSSDEGTSWSDAIQIGTSALHPALFTSRDNLRHVFWYESGTIKTRIHDETYTPITSSISIFASGEEIDNSGFGVDEYIIGGGLKVIGINYLKGGTPFFKYSRDGTVWN